jgi:hypothetical protein
MAFVVFGQNDRQVLRGHNRLLSKMGTARGQ